MSAPPPYAPGQTSYQQVPQGYQQGYQQGPPPITNAPGTGYTPGSIQGYQSGAPMGYQAIPGPPASTTYVYVRGNCPACQTGTLQDEFTGLGICLAIFFFPLGILCCLLLTEKRCTHCGMRYS